MVNLTILNSVWFIPIASVSLLILLIIGIAYFVNKPTKVIRNSPALNEAQEEFINEHDHNEHITKANVCLGEGGKQLASNIVRDFSSDSKKEEPEYTKKGEPRYIQREGTKYISGIDPYARPNDSESLDNTVNTNAQIMTKEDYDKLSDDEKEIMIAYYKSMNDESQIPYYLK
jgi:hypothetical protein